MLPAAITIILIFTGIILAGVYASSRFHLLSLRVETLERALLELSEKVNKLDD